MVKMIPYVRGLPIIGTSLSILAAGSSPKLHLYIDRKHKKLGPIFKENMGTVCGIFLADPWAARTIFSAEGRYPKHIVPEPWKVYNKLYNCNRGLFFMDGEEWLKYRQIMNKFMLKRNLPDKQVQEFVINSFMESMENFVGKEMYNIEQKFYQLSISFIVGTLVGTAIMDKMECIKKDIDSLALVVNSIFSTTTNLMNIPMSLATSLNMKIWEEFIKSAEYSLMAGRVLLEKIKGFPLSDGLLKDLLEEDLDDDIITGLVMDLILAAGDTSAYTSQWALYLLSREPEVADQVRSNNQLVTGVIKEALRLYPAAIFISRYLDRDVILPTLDCQLSKGELVMLSLYTIGRLESAYTEPLKFLPERWTRRGDNNSREYLGVKEPKAWLPFGVGARSCIGRRLAEAQLHLTISKIISQYRLHLVEPVDMELRMVPVPTKPIKIKVDRL
ncbi:cytochrome P450 315a1, mitochondrial [Halyomorpha halys]|uniref:cytochrome P450 315a1, mitochondrial n=1 Tax=Halyomorpha halys TaxID=286706 RepID=UPI0006D5218E|nr:cytochrome P450 315a1, mitochondrial [Halyomorpha halys]